VALAPMMTTELDRLSIHVLGAGKGESIIMRLPNGSWGVIDCCASSSKDRTKNETLKFLFEQNVKELEFVCLTHSHDDHYRGMSHILETFHVRYFWRFNGLGGPHFQRLVQYFRVDAEELGGADEISGAAEFERIFGLVGEKRKSQDPALRVKRSGPDVPLYPVPSTDSDLFKIIGLAPCGNQVELYETEFARCFNSDGTVRARLAHSHHNLASVALLVVYGETRIILGGDVEEDGWRDVLVEVGAKKLSASLVKASHHGSPTGHCDGLWPHFAAKSKPLAVVTAYASQNLPRKAVLEHITQHAESVMVTCFPSLKEKELPDGLDATVFRSRLALMSKMGRLTKSQSYPCGRCSFVFDIEGSCVEATTHGAAQVLIP
jgi:beta-lactamase superfamily II metal-dependent hydrolase